MEKEETVVDNKLAYRYITSSYQYGKEDTKNKVAPTYKDKRIFMLMFNDRESDFNDSNELGQEMTNSFEFLY